MLTLSPQDYFNPEKYVNKICGLFGEFAHPVNDLEKSISYWEKSVLQRSRKYFSLSVGNYFRWMSIVGLHQTKNFSYPAITFFAHMKAKSRIKRPINGFVEQVVRYCFEHPKNSTSISSIRM